VSRICLHCVLARALRAEAPTLAERGLEVKLGPSEAVFLPGSGQKAYRRLRSLLREAAAQTNGDRLKLTVLDLPGKSHVEVTATFATAFGARVLSRAFPLQDPAMLARGFAEQA
jgi:hypothetical protein